MFEDVEAMVMVMEMVMVWIKIHLIVAQCRSNRHIRVFNVLQRDEQ